MLERRNGLAIGIFNRLHEGGRAADRATSVEVQHCLDAVLKHGGFSAYQMAVGSNPVDLSFWKDKLRRILARDRTSESTGMAVGDSAIFHKRISRQRDPRRRGAACILGIYEKRLTNKFRSQSFKVARDCVRKRMATSPDTPVVGQSAQEVLHVGKMRMT